MPLLKNTYGNVKIIIYYDIIGQIKNYMVVNELKKFTWKELIKKNFLICILRKKTQIDPKMIIILIYQNMVDFMPFKSPFFSWLKFFSKFFAFMFIFYLIYHILSPYKISKKNHT
jgi:hypothetical protein